MRIDVVVAQAPRQVLEVTLDVDEPCSVLQALRQSGLVEGIDLKHRTVGVWGRQVTLDDGLCDRDRVEVYRDVPVDPQAARRKRFAEQGVRGAGLFARRFPTTTPRPTLKHRPR